MRRGRVTRTGPLAARRLARHRLGWAAVPVLAGFTALVVLSLGVPVGASVYWIFAGGIPALNGVSLPTAALHTAGYGAAAGALDTLAAAGDHRRRRGPAGRRAGAGHRLRLPRP